MSDVVPARQKANSPMVWIQFLAGPVLWAVHFLISYLLVEASCQAGWNFKIGGFNSVSFIVMILTILAVIGTGLFALRSYRGWRNVHADRNLRCQFRESGTWFEGPVDFLYFSGFLLSLLFAVTILMVGLPTLFLHPC